MEREPASPTTPGAFESLQSRANSIRRARPPDLELLGDEKRIPLRPDSRTARMGKRDSRVGLRSIFGRGKAGKEGKEVEGFSSLRETSSTRPGGIRASLAEISNWPYSLHSPRSEVALSSPPPTAKSASAALHNQPTPIRVRQPNGQNRALPPLSTPPSRPARVAWSPPPLFQVYPQAVKHATLPACTVSADSLLRLNGSRGSLLMGDDFGVGSLHLEQETGERTKKRHGHRRTSSRNILEWTTKIYVLVTSGYLLQYASEGSFDRLPEKVLQLTKESAAFASDLIPGRHWVLQVSSYTDADGMPAMDSRSLLSKLSLRPSDRRQVSNILLVFESAEDMDGWLATLRLEIEALGGKKKLSETGKAEENTLPLRAQASQRTLVIRDPERFSPTIIQQDFSWTSPNALRDENDGLSAIPSSESTPDLALDDVSTSESHYSSDGQRLDSLRDSGNRLSFISSGQRTFITSEGSSPACSPTRASFSSHFDDNKLTEPLPEIRPRPNAQAISKRRKSMQMTIPGFDMRFDPGNRPHSTVTGSYHDDHQYVSARQSIPNFSVPHVVNKRFSSLRSTPLDFNDYVPVIEQENIPRTVRKLPPTSLAMSRPLSVVVDQPSPRSPFPPKETIRSIAETQRSPAEEAPDSPSMFSSWVHYPSRSQKGDLPSRGSSLAPEKSKPPSAHQNGRITPRRFDSTSTIKGQPESSKSESDTIHFILPKATSSHQARVHSLSGLLDEQPRALATLDCNMERRLSTSPGAKLPRRASFQADDLPSRLSRHCFANSGSWDDRIDELKPSSPPVSLDNFHSLKFHSNSITTTDHRTRTLLNRRSMPQLTEGPPPVPPPTCALPPIPQKHEEIAHSSTSQAIRA